MLINKIPYVFKRICCFTKPGLCVLKYLLSKLVLIQQTNFKVCTSCTFY